MSPPPFNANAILKHPFTETVAVVGPTAGSSQPRIPDSQSVSDHNDSRNGGGGGGGDDSNRVMGANIEIVSSFLV